MTTLNPETQSFTFHHVAEKVEKGYYRWDCNTCRVYWNEDNNLSSVQTAAYSPVVAKRCIEQGVWVIDSVKNPLEVIELPEAITLGAFMAELEDVVPMDAKIHYTAEWDYSVDYGVDCKIDVSKVLVKFKDNWVELPIILLERELEYIEDRIVEEISV